MVLFSFNDPFSPRYFFRSPLSPLTTDDSFRLNLNVSHFKPEEISIKLTDDNVLIIEGKHEEKKDEDGSIARHFLKKCAIPDGFDVAKIETGLFDGGILSVKVPRVKKIDGADQSSFKTIPVKRVKGEGFSLKSKL